MAKKRKTRSQKLAAEVKRHDITYQGSQSPSLSYTPTTRPPAAVAPTRPHNSVIEYGFVRHDLKKTSAITGAIIIVELVLSFLMK